MFKSTLLGVALASAAFCAQAVPTAGLGSLSSSFITLTGVIKDGGGNVSGGALYGPSENYGGTRAARPTDVASSTFTSGTWLASGPYHADSAKRNDNNGGGDATLSLGAGITGVSFLWGSPDTYNSFSVTTSSGTTVFAPGAFGVSVLLNGDQNAAYYVNFTTTGSETITSLKFMSPSTNAIEIANVAVVPEPESYGLALAGLSVVGFAMARRRKV